MLKELISVISGKNLSNTVLAVAQSDLDQEDADAGRRTIKPTRVRIHHWRRRTFEWAQDGDLTICEKKYCNDRFTYGFAYCAPDDQFVKFIGRAVAFNSPYAITQKELNCFEVEELAKLCGPGWVR